MSLALLGFAWSVRRDWTAWAARLLWVLPFHLALAAQENWDYENKMNVGLALFLPLLDWTLLDLRAPVDRPRLFAPVTIVIVGAVWGGAVLLAQVDGVPDPRYIEA